MKGYTFKFNEFATHKDLQVPMTKKIIFIIDGSNVIKDYTCNKY